MSTTVNTPRGEGRIIDSEVTRGATRHRVAGIGFDVWFPATQVHVASAEDGWEPIPEDEHPGDPFSEAGLPPEAGLGEALPPEAGGAPPVDGDFANELDALAEFAATGQISPDAQAEFGGSPDPAAILGRRFWAVDSTVPAAPGSPVDRMMTPEATPGQQFGAADGILQQMPMLPGTPPPPEGGNKNASVFHRHRRLAGPGDDVDHDNSVKLPYNPDPQHDAVNQGQTDASWGPGEYTIDADERLSPADSLTFNHADQDESGPYPGPAPHLFATRHLFGESAGLEGYLDQPAKSFEDYPPEAQHAIKELAEHQGTSIHDAMEAYESGREKLGSWLSTDAFDAERPEEGPSEPDMFDRAKGWFDDITAEPPFELDVQTVHPGDDSDEFENRELDPGEWEDHKRRMMREDSRQDRQEGRPPSGDPAAFGDQAGFAARGRAAAINLGPKYVQVGYGIHTADHHTSLIQQFRDDPHAMIERRGAMLMGAHDGELDRYAALLDADEMIRTAAWRDVRAKAKRLRDSGMIKVKDLGIDRIYATVQGDNGTYETMITKGSSLGGFDAFETYGDQSVGNWHCSCKWGNWAFKRRFTHIGRLCSHGLASYWEMQAAHQAKAAKTDKGYGAAKAKRVKRAFHDDDDNGLAYLIDHYGPNDNVDREHDFAERTDRARDYAERSDLPGDADDVPLGLTANILRMTPRSLTPNLNFIDRHDFDTETVDVTALGDEQDMPGASDEGELPEDAATKEEREAALHIGRRFVASLVDEIMPDFEEWYAQNYGRELSQAQPTEANEAAADYATSRGLDQAASEMLQEWVAQNFSPEDAQPGSDAEDEIHHFTAAAGRYLMHVARRRTADSAYPSVKIPSQAPGTGSMPLAPELRGPSTPRQLSIDAPGKFEGYDFDAVGGLGGGAGAQAERRGQPAGGGSVSLPGQSAPAPNDLAGIGGSEPHGGAAAPSTPAAAPKANESAPVGGGTGGGGWQRSTDTSAIGGDNYQVQSGDTLADIAQRSGYGGNYQDLATANGIADPNKIDVGQTINFSAPGRGTAPGSPASGEGTGPTPGPSSDASSTPTTPEAPTTPTTPSTPTATPEAAGSTVDSFDSHKSSSRTARYVMASDDALLDRLRGLAQNGDGGDHSQHHDSHNQDVRDTIDELRDRGYDASTLVAMVRTADNEEDKKKAPSWASPENANPGLNNPAAPAASSTPAAPAADGGSIPVSFPQPGAGGSTPQSPTTTTPAPSSSGGGGGAGNGNVPPRPQGPSAESVIGGGESLPGGSQTKPEGTKNPTSESGAAGGGGGDFLQSMGDFSSMISPIMQGIGDIGGLLGGGGIGDLGGLVSGIGDLGKAFTGSFHYADDDDMPLLGEDALSVTKSPDSFAGSGPDHQRWHSSSEDYVNAHELDNRHDIDDFEGDILKYSGVQPPGTVHVGADFLAAMTSREANAFDDYADWAHAKSDSYDVDSWPSADEFIRAAEDDLGDPSLDFEPARNQIDDYKQYSTAALQHMAAGANAGYFGVGASPQLPSSDGMGHTNGAANLKGVTKPKKVKPPKAPKAIQPQRAQQSQQPMGGSGLFSEPPPPPQQAGPPIGYGFEPPGSPQFGQQQLAAPRSAAVGGGGMMFAASEPKAGGIQRQGTQMGAGTLASAFGDIQAVAPQSYAQPGYAPVVDYNPYRQANQALPTHTTPWDDDPGFLSGQHTAAVDDDYGFQAYEQPAPQQHFASHGSMSLAPREVAHDPNHAAQMGEYIAPRLGQYGRTDDASEVVRQFQARMGGGDWSTQDQYTGVGGYDPSAGAQAFLARTAGRVYSQAEQAMLEQEAHPGGARNLDQLDLRGTHYIGG